MTSMPYLLNKARFISIISPFCICYNFIPFRVALLTKDAVISVEIPTEENRVNNMEQQVEGRNEGWPCAKLVNKQESLI